MITFPLAIKTAGSIILAATAFPACPNVPPPQIGVRMVMEKPIIQHGLSKADMAKARADTKVPYQMQDLQHVGRGGMMRGDIHVNYDVKTSAVPGNTLETVNQNCVRYDRVQVTLDLAPIIYIAKDYDEKSCWYNQILQHEESHIDMDRVVIEKYVERIKNGLMLAFSEPGDAIQGPVKPHQVDSLKKSMGEQLVNITTGLVADMSRERQEKQQGVDSIKGYAFIMNSCYQGDNVLQVKP